MELEDFLSFSYLVVLLACFLLSLSVYFKKNVPYYLIYFPPFLLITFIMEIIGKITALKYGPNQAIGSFFSIIEYTFYFFVLYQIYSHGKIRKTLIFIICSYPLIALVNIFFNYSKRQKIFKY